MFPNVQRLVNRRAKAVVGAGLRAIQRGWLPPICLLCGASGTNGRDLCAGCADDLPQNVAACPSCAFPLASGGDGLCQHCQSHSSHSWTFDRAFAPFLYRPPVSYLIRGLKYNGRLSHARLLGELFAASLAARDAPPPDCIVPVPLHPLRLRERGFNQATELARAAARQYRIPLLEGLRRVRHTTPQIQLDAQHRRTNPLGAFALGRASIGSRVAIMDDVITTASTVAECARILRAGGATDIEIWAIARAADS